jgi:hypothetical protein
MIALTIALASMIGIIIIFFLKLFNIFKISEGKELYDAKLSWITLALALLFLSAYFISLLNAIGMSDTVQNPEGGIYTLKNNEYYSLVNYFYALVTLVFVIGVMTIVELMFSVAIMANRMSTDFKGLANRMG